MSNSYGRQVVLTLTNKSGGGVVAGDVVVNDSTNNDAFTTTTSAGATSMVGVVQETIANNATGRVLIAGYAALVNVNASVTRGNYGKTHTVAKQATSAGASRVAGAFCQFLTGGTTPDAVLFGFPDGSTGSAGSPGTPALTLSTTNSTGSAVTLIATDATIAAFDATVPTTQALGDAAAAGSAGVAARRDHKHAMPATTAVPGGELDYVEKTSNTSITATTEGTANTIVTSNAITFDGAPVIMEFYSQGVQTQLVASSDITILLRDDTAATVLGDIAYHATPAAATNYHPVYVRRRFTPAAGSRTYSIRAFVAGGTGTVLGGAGGTGNASMPAFIRFTKV